MIESQRHSYHLVDPSPWPISGSLGALATTVGGVMYMHSFQGGATLLSLGLILILVFLTLLLIVKERGRPKGAIWIGYGALPLYFNE
ncbi:oxidase [Lithospermum erythrorhizon]|uniref:Cytochrome c oxidase subunit 3 n=1 Tax=Lithospermum erythrorhizon TaxID=34254 RepID=A0AAV3P2F7_LITER